MPVLLGKVLPPKQMLGLLLLLCKNPEVEGYEAEAPPSGEVYESGIRSRRAELEDFCRGSGTEATLNVDISIGATPSTETVDRPEVEARC